MQEKAKLSFLKKLEQQDLTSYLQDVHYDLYPSLLDDDIPDHFDAWVDQLSFDAIVEYSRRMCLVPHVRIAKEFVGECD